MLPVEPLTCGLCVSQGSGLRAQRHNQTLTPTLTPTLPQHGVGHAPKHKTPRQDFHTHPHPETLEQPKPNPNPNPNSPSSPLPPLPPLPPMVSRWSCALTRTLTLTLTLTLALTLTLTLTLTLALTLTLTLTLTNTHRVHVLDPDGVHGPVQNAPLAVVGLVAGQNAVPRAQHAVLPLLRGVRVRAKVRVGVSTG